jgi:TolA-binding protein
MRCAKVLLAVAVALAAALPLAAQSARPSGALAEGIDHFQAGRYDQALVAFRGIVLSQSDDPQKPAAYFWLAKTLLAAGRIDDAARNLEYYLATWPNAADRAEAVYLQGRVLHQQEDYEAALRVFQAFLAEFPTSAYAANAWFWSAECLFELGRLEEASVLYQKVLREYPTSPKVEAAQYRASLIGLKQRELELSRLLRWSHEEFLRTVEEYRRRQDASNQTIAVLRKRLGDGGADVTSAELSGAAPAASDTESAAQQAGLAQKTAEADQLRARVAELESQLTAAHQAVASAEAAGEAGAAETQRLLALKAEALALKEKLLDLLLGKGVQP